MKIRRNLASVRMASYYTAAFLSIMGLTLMVTFLLVIVIALKYHRYLPEYVYGEEVMEELTLTPEGYVLSRAMEERLAGLDQWAMLLNEDGEVVWSCHKPAEIPEAYSLSEIARMSRFYLQDYPVYMRVWDDRIMVAALPKGSMWRYNMEYPIPWIAYVKKIWFWVALGEFMWILALAFFFTRRAARGREQARIEWISGISHDIRTPLSMVLGYSDALEDSESLSEEERRRMAVIRRQSLVMKELVEDLNLTSRLEYSMQALRVEKVRPAAVLREVSAAFLGDAREGELDIDIVISGQAEELWIKADRQLFVRALRNLFHNSLQHSEQGGMTVIDLRMWKKGRFCHISFSDNGVGYSEETLRQLHSRRGRRTTLKIRGLGIVQKVVLAHRGKIRFANNRQGGCFCEMRFRAYCLKR